MNENFLKSYDILIKHEGGYVNDPDDKGGETYKGIARKFNPDWKGWKIIDKSDKKNLDKNLELEELVKEFYKREYWDYFSLDEIPYPVCMEIFESAVNVGKGKATVFIQTACNVLNNDGKLYPDIPADGKFGKNTLETLKKAISTRGSRLVFNVLNILQGSYYIELMLMNKRNEKWVGWFSRIEILR